MIKKIIIILCVFFISNTYSQNSTAIKQVKKVEVDTLKEIRVNKKQEVKKVELVKNTKTLKEVQKSKKQKVKKVPSDGEEKRQLKEVRKDNRKEVKKVELLKKTKTLKEKSNKENQSVLNSNLNERVFLIGHLKKSPKGYLFIMNNQEPVLLRNLKRQ